jgi:spermidine/putrescine ABC transporter ATP-binding subunit
MDRNEAYIHIDHVSKHFGAVKAVDGVDIQVGSGEFFSLLGASGCGKTTLLRLLGGFEWPTSGEIYIDRQPMSEVPAHRRPSNMVFQNYGIFPHLNVRANVAYGLRKDKLSKEEVSKRVGEALEMVKLGGFEARRSHELSGGQRQRVALARALIKRPKVLLLDEPLGALDRKLREEMQLELRKLQKTVGITFIFVTHDQEEALTMSDRIAVMSTGRVLQIASPKELYERPNSMEVAAFIGQMNFLDATVEEVHNGWVVAQAPGLGRVKAPARGSLAQGARVTAAIRPEKLRLVFERGGDGANAVEGRVGDSAYLGNRSHYFVHVSGCDVPLAVAAQEGEVVLGDRVGSQKQVWLTWADDSLVLLPRE